MNIYSQISSNKRKTWIFILGFIVFISLIGWVIGQAMDAGYTPLTIAGIVSILMAIGSYYYSDKLVLAISGAKEVKHSENPEIYHIVENLCIGAGLPFPKVYIIEDTAPNAFATGRDPKHAVIAVTTGLLQKLDKPELEGVIAHELSHIQNFDTRLMTIVSILAGSIVLLSDFFLRWTWWGGGRRSRNRNEEGGQLQLIIFVLAIVLAILSPIIAQLIKLAISRKREFLADASAALLTRYPDGLARALEKISKDTEPLEVANKATAHLYIINPLKEHEGTTRGWFAAMFMTHPPVEERIAALRAM